MSISDPTVVQLEPENLAELSRSPPDPGQSRVERGDERGRGSGLDGQLEISSRPRTVLSRTACPAEVSEQHRQRRRVADDRGKCPFAWPEFGERRGDIVHHPQSGLTPLLLEERRPPTLCSQRRRVHGGAHPPHGIHYGSPSAPCRLPTQFRLSGFGGHSPAALLGRLHTVCASWTRQATGRWRDPLLELDELESRRSLAGRRLGLAALCLVVARLSSSRCGLA